MPSRVDFCQARRIAVAAQRRHKNKEQADGTKADQQTAAHEASTPRLLFSRYRLASIQNRYVTQLIRSHLTFASIYSTTCGRNAFA
jgi:hypothetical protein